MAADAPDMSEYLGVFLDEAEEQVETLDDGILRLEKEPDDQGLLQEIFRAAHSLKSSSAAMGFANMSRLCHASENILDRFRAGDMRPNTEVIDVLLRAVDALKTIKEAIRGGESDALDISEVVAALEASAAGTEDAGPTGDSSAPPPDGRDGDEDEERLMEADAREVVVRLTDDCAMPSVRAQIVLKALEKIGEILRTDWRDSEDAPLAGRDQRGPHRRTAPNNDGGEGERAGDSGGTRVHLRDRSGGGEWGRASCGRGP